MTPSSPSVPEVLQNVSVTVPLGDRWQVRDRLQALEIPCHCESDGSLRVSIDSPLAAIQAWSVLSWWSVPRQHQADWLERCLAAG